VHSTSCVECQPPGGANRAGGTIQLSQVYHFWRSYARNGQQAHQVDRLRAVRHRYAPTPAGSAAGGQHVAAGSRSKHVAQHRVPVATSREYGVPSGTGALHS
jgi:hypothetical protein